MTAGYVCIPVSSLFFTNKTKTNKNTTKTSRLNHPLSLLPFPHVSVPLFSFLNKTRSNTQFTLQPPPPYSNKHPLQTRMGQLVMFLFPFSHVYVPRSMPNLPDSPPSRELLSAPRRGHVPRKLPQVLLRPCVTILPPVHLWRVSRQCQRVPDCPGVL